MKLSEIYIDELQQFKDFTLNLTYPKGHRLEGRPLEKVCIIGQSGTGKTTLLNLIQAFTKQYTKISEFFQPVSRLANNKQSDFSINDQSNRALQIRLKYLFNDLEFELAKRNGISGKKWNLQVSGNEGLIKDSQQLQIKFRSQLRKTDHFLISYPADINIRHEFTRRKTADLTFNDKRIIDFQSQKLTPIWSKVYKDVVDFQNEEANFRIDLTKQAEIENIDIKEKIGEWKRSTKNPLIGLAKKCLNPVIENFGLKVETDLPKIQDIDVIRLKSSINKKIIPFEKLSSGTKQFILTAIPLYELNTTNSIVLIDEPEVSLFPDIQLMIVDYYKKLAKQSQFFYATHSPVIASSFEPWEIVELKFDYERGRVYREEYYDVNKERHVDNFMINPQYLRWDSILTKVFDLEVRANEKRTGKMMDLAMLEKEIKNSTDTNQKKSKFEEYKKLATLLDWEIR